MLSGSGDHCVSVSGALTDNGSVLMKTEEVIVSAEMMHAMSDLMFLLNCDLEGHIVENAWIRCASKKTPLETLT